MVIGEYEIDWDEWWLSLADDLPGLAVYVVYTEPEKPWRWLAWFLNKFPTLP